MEMLDLIKIIFAINAFYSFAITGLAYSLPEDSLNYMTSYSGGTVIGTGTEISQQLEDNLDQQTNIPVIDIGALIFYSSNIVVNLIMNFIFAIPEMIGFLVTGVVFILGFDTFLINQLQILLSALMIGVYVIGVISTLMKLRSGQVI